MNSKEIIACLRKVDDSPDVAELLTTLNVKKKLRIPKDDIEARIDLPKQGLSLIFKPAGSKTSELIFTAVQFFSDSEEGYVNFQGELPCNLLFSDTQTEVRKKLGKPVESLKQRRRDRWEREGLVLTVKYSQEDGRVAMISFHVPEFY
jgi:hypothetical protein